MKKLCRFSCLFLLSFLSSLSLAGNPELGKAKSAACSGCHGADGNSFAPSFPKLAGQGETYIIKQLKEYKSGKRQNATMYAMAAMLSDDDISDIAAFYSNQSGSMGAADKEQVELGQLIYRAGNASSGVAACAACHGPRGSGNPQAKFPKLSGQHAEYTVDQLHKFKKSERANDANQMMRGVASKMSDAEIKAVAQYIQGLR